MMTQTELDNYIPKTKLGELLLKIKKEYIKKGGKVLNDEEFDEYLRALKKEGDKIDEHH